MTGRPSSPARQSAARTKRIASLKKSIALQERTLKILEEIQVVYDNGKTIELTKTILNTLKAQLSILNANV